MWQVLQESISDIFLTNVPSFIPWKHQEIFVFLVFSGSGKNENIGQRWDNVEKFWKFSSDQSSQWKQQLDQSQEHILKGFLLSFLEIFSLLWKNF